MKGKTHVAIGSAVVFSGTYLYLGGDFSIGNLTQVLVPAMLGAVVGSYMADIDSKKSKASQIFNRVFLVIIVLLFVSSYFDINLLNNIIKGSTNYLMSNLFNIGFIILVVLGKLSPHRMFTHKVLGTFLFCSVAYVCFGKYMGIGFIVGYICHIIADRFTADGKNLNFFSICLPLTNSKGKLSYHF